MQDLTPLFLPLRSVYAMLIIRLLGYRLTVVCQQSADTSEMAKPFGSFTALAITILILLLCKPALAADDSLWLTSGLRSWHNNQDQEQFRENNTGIGLSYGMPHDINIVAGTYINSDDYRTNYSGAMFQPLEIVGVHLGIFVAFFTGYSSADFETSVIPMASYEYKSVGVNLFWVPAKVTALQLKFRLAEF